MTTDTIAAIATAPGRGGVGIVRISGPQAYVIAQQLVGELTPRQAHYLPFSAAGQLLDQGIAIYFKAPHSYTGEDVVELQGHGGPVVLDSLLQACLALGARMARPGEFTERAFLNDKLDLAQAEAVADLIEASSEQAARSAMRSLQGAFSQRVQQLTEALIQLRIYVEAAIDFPEEEIDFLSDGHIEAQLQQVQDQLQQLLQQSQQGARLREGMTLVIVGRPNAGKSSLLNALAGKDSAIVTHVAGTTRDIVQEQIHLDGMPLHIIDTAGLRESDDPVEQIGIQRAWEAMATADRLLVVQDVQQQAGADDLVQQIAQRYPQLGISYVYNKIDLTQQAPQLCQRQDQPTLYLSAKTGAGLPLLIQHLKDCVGFEGGGEDSFIARRRHLDALHQAQSQLEQAWQQLTLRAAGELVAEDLRQAQQALVEITGEFSSDDLLGRIFSSFCIGK